MTAGPFPALPAYPLKQKLSIDGTNVVLLDVPPEADFPQNIFGLNEKGDVLWQVEPRPSTAPHNKYTSMRDELGIVVARTEDGYQRKIDPRSGRVLHEEQVPET